MLNWQLLTIGASGSGDDIGVTMRSMRTGITSVTIDELLQKLNKIATDCSPFDYGLPLHDEWQEQLREVVEKFAGERFAAAYKQGKTDGRDLGAHIASEYSNNAGVLGSIGEYHAAAGLNIARAIRNAE